MLRFIGLIMGLLVLTTSAVAAGDNPVLVINAPKQAVAGTPFTVNVEVTNGDIQGIARYMQTLPYGVKIEPLECANSDFEFNNQTLKLMWFSLEKTNSLKFSYKVVTHANIKGSLKLSGAFVFANSDNVHGNASVQDAIVEITPSPNIKASNIVDLKNVKTQPIQESTFTFIPATQQMESMKMPSKALRQISYDAKRDAYLVSILLDKGKASKYAKLEETIPAGYTAEAVDTRTGVFDFSNGKVKFLWLDLPNQPRFLVSYRLKPKGKQADGKSLSINGFFAFMIDDATEIHEVAQVQSDLKKFAIGTDSRSKSPSTVAAGPRDIPIKYVGIAKKAQQTGKEAQVKIAAEQTTKAPSKTISTGTSTASTTSKTEAPKPNAPERKVKEGIVFKVQLAAVTKEADAAGAANSIKVDQPLVKEENHGMIRYLVGPFTSYNDAINAKNSAKQNGMKDAFIVAYNQQGNRIAVSEAFASDKK